MSILCDCRSWVLRVWLIQKEMQIVRHLHELQHDWKSYGSSSLLSSYFHVTPYKFKNYFSLHFHEKKKNELCDARKGYPLQREVYLQF